MAQLKTYKYNTVSALLINLAFIQILLHSKIILEAVEITYFERISKYAG